MSAGEFIYVVEGVPRFYEFFEQDASDTTVIESGTGAMSINGDDAIELFFNGNVIETFGDIDVGWYWHALGIQRWFVLTGYQAMDMMTRLLLVI